MSWFKHQFRSLIGLANWWQTRLGLGGKVIVCLLIVCMPEMTNLNSPIFLLCAVLVSLLSVSMLVSRHLQPSLQSRVAVDGFTGVGQTLPIKFTIENLRNRPAFDLQIQLFGADDVQRWNSSRDVFTVPAHGSFRVDCEFTASRRGVYPVPQLKVRSGFPLNVVRSFLRLHVDGEVVVHPAFERLTDYDLGQATSINGGALDHTFISMGESVEYVGSREYLPGISVRRWDYGSWARLGKPIIREFSSPNRPVFGLFLDYWHPYNTIPEPGESIPEFESLVSQAAACGEWIIRQQAELSFLSNGGETRRLEKGNPDQLLDQLLRILAMVQPAAKDEFLRIDIDQWYREFSPQYVIAISNCKDEPSSNRCISLLKNYCHVIEMRASHKQSRLNRCSTLVAGNSAAASELTLNSSKLGES